MGATLSGPRKNAVAMNINFLKIPKHIMPLKYVQGCDSESFDDPRLYASEESGKDLSDS